MNCLPATSSRLHLHYYVRIYCPLLVSLLFSYHVTAQKQSSGVYDNVNNLGYLDAKVIEMDSSLNLAKESAPFDKTFFIKVKRLSKAISIKPAGTETTTIKVTEKATTDSVGNTTEKSITQVTSKDIPGTGQAVSPTAVKKVTLTSKNLFDQTVTLDPGIIRVRPSNTNSDYVFFEVSALVPERAYIMEVVWSTDITTIYNFSTVSSTLDKRLKQRIVPEIGVMSAIFKMSDKSYHAPVSLMLAFYYHFRAIDTDLPMKSYKPLSWQRFSLMGGVTINSFAVDNIRDDLIGDSNLLLGIGYQPFDALRLSYGAMFFNEIYPNRTSVDRKSIKSTSYIALTLDIKLKDLLGGIISVLGFK